MSLRDSGRSTISFSSPDCFDSANKAPDLPPLNKKCKRLFLVRHGQVIDPGGERPVHYGALDVPLSYYGELEAVAAADFLKQMHLDHVACSSLKRARFGAEQILLRQGHLLDNNYGISTYEGFKELARGAWCGKTVDDIGEGILDRFNACDESVTPNGGESYPALKRRVLAELQTLLEQLKTGQSAVLVSHMHVSRCLLSDALDIPNSKMVRSIQIATASITCIDYNSNNQPEIVHFRSYKPSVDKWG